MPVGTLLHPEVPQPDGRQMYRCVTEAPGRQPGEIVPISTLSFELAGGSLWPQVADWEAVSVAVVAVARAGRCDSLRFGASDLTRTLLANGPTTVHTAFFTDGSGQRQLGPADRVKELAILHGHLQTMLATGPLWPGNGLLPVPTQPARMPYQLFAPLPDTPQSTSAATTARSTNPATPDHQMFESNMAPDLASIRRAHDAVVRDIADHQPSAVSDDYKQACLLTLRWALGWQATAPVTHAARGPALPGTDEARREQYAAYDEMHRLGPRHERYQFVVGVENAAGWLATGSGLYLG